MPEKHPSVVSPQEYGRRGYEVVLEKYGKARMDTWRRRGGRKPNPTWAQIQAGTEPQRARPSRKRKEAAPIGQTQTRFE